MIPDFQMAAGTHHFSLNNDDEDDVVELLWRNGQVVAHTQNNHRSLLPKSPHLHDIASSLDYSFLDDHYFSSDLLFPSQPHSSLLHPSNSNLMLRHSMVDSSETPSVAPKSKVSNMARGVYDLHLPTAAGDEVPEKHIVCEITVTSSPDLSSASASAENAAAPKLAAGDRKRKGRAPDDTDCLSEDVEYDSADIKEQLRGSTSTKRSRAAEVHNLSERRRRDRINEKMKALQELIPRCNKTDKASMLDEAIEYLKTLQLQVQMMSMGCGMMPMMFPGAQQYLSPPMGMGIGMGMGMGMEMGMNRPMMQFPNLLAGSNLPMQGGAAASAAHLDPRFRFPAFAMPPVPGSDPSQPHPMFNSAGTQNTMPPSGSGFPDSYQQFCSSNQMQFLMNMSQFLQNQQVVQPTTSRPSAEKNPENLENH